MSASLVGSEMCIRDSHPCNNPALAAGFPIPGCLDQHLPRGKGAHGGAVSYTHLTLPTICSV
eukprot:1082724-Alexandrium_andersonii.AAC.1